jgi:AraC-like DNA-binding protein
MEFAELFVRIAGITLLLLLAAFCLRDARDVAAARFGFLLCVSLTAVMATSISANSAAPPEAWRVVLSPVSSSTAIFIWWFCLSLLYDNFRLRRLEWGVAIAWTAFGLVNLGDFIKLAPPQYQWANIARSFLATGIVAHIVYVALKGRRTDLVEGRRRARVFIAVAISVLFLTDLYGERVYGYYYTPIAVNVAQLSAFVAVIVWSAFWLLRLDRSMLAFEKRAPAPETAAPTLTPKERILHDKLATAMETEKIYLESDLSIGALAERIGAPEHQLRALINKSMGHRNFRSFLNGYRMAEAKAALSDSEKASLPILTIAMDSGFASLASFNRAFKLETGATPSDFRNAALAPDSAAQN